MTTPNVLEQTHVRDSDVLPSFGVALRRCRLAAGLTQESLAERSGVAKRTLQELERGAARPRVETARRLIAVLAPPPEIRAQFEAAISAPRRGRRRVDRDDADEPAVAVSVAQSIRLTSFIGRERELDQVRTLLETCRLLTLTGAGGCGKTRLALELADRLAPTYSGGVFVVSLAAIADPGLVASSVAEHLGLQELAGEPLPTTLARRIGTSKLLLVLDNFEHVVPAGPMLTELLAACPRLTVLVTSREVLRLHGEQAYPVPPLTLPRLGGPPSDDREVVSHVLESEAGRLFVDRARRAQPAFRLDAANAPAVAEICRRLDGLPLALELAAARARFLTPEPLLARLEHRLTLLTGGARDVPVRQQTLRAAIAWSHDLLNEPEQQIFRRLAVFVGGFTLDAASWVMADGGVDRASPTSGTRNPEPTTLDLVGSLVEKSLLRPEEPSEREPRFTMLETIREYALEELEASGEAAELRRRHAEHFLALAEAAEPHLIRAEAGAWLDRLQAEHDNLRAALAWSADAADRIDLLAGIAGPLYWFWWMRGHFSEGRRWLGRALARTTDPAARVKLLYGAGELAFFQEQTQQAREHWTEMVALGRAIHDEAVVARALGRLAYLLRLVGESDRAVTLAEESLAISRRLDDPRGIAHALHGYAQVLVGLGDLDRAESTWTEAVELFRQVGVVVPIPYALANLAHIARQRGELDKAIALFQEADALVRQRGDKFGARGMVLGMLRIGYHQGDDGRVLAMARQALELGRAQGSAGATALALEGLAWVAVMRDDPVRAARLLGSAETVRATSGPGTNAPQPDLVADTLAAATAALGEEACAAARAEGRAMHLDQAIALALTTPSAG